MFFLVQNPKENDRSGYKFVLENTCWEKMYRTNEDLQQWTKFFEIIFDKKERPV